MQEVWRVDCCLGRQSIDVGEAQNTAGWWNDRCARRTLVESDPWRATFVFKLVKLGALVHVNDRRHTRPLVTGDAWP